MRAIRVILTVIAGLSLLLANTSWPWKIISLAGLVLTSAFVSIQTQRHSGIHGMRLYNNGAVTLLLDNRSEIPAVIKEGAWLNRWVSVLCIRRLDQRSPLRLIISRNRNQADNYRGMLKLIRLGLTADALIT